MVGQCPVCWEADGMPNVKTNLYVCHKHRVWWCIGMKEYSSLSHENESIWEANAQLLQGYTEVEPIFPPDDFRMPDNMLFMSNLNDVRHIVLAPDENVLERLIAAFTKRLSLLQPRIVRQTR